MELVPRLHECQALAVSGPRVSPRRHGKVKRLLLVLKLGDHDNDRESRQPCLFCRRAVTRKVRILRQLVFTEPQ